MPRSPQAYHRPCIIATLILAFCLPTCALDLMPVPKSMQSVKGTVDISAGTYSLTGPASPQVEYALEVLAKALGPKAQRVQPADAVIQLRPADSWADLARAASAVGLSAPAEDVWREAYVADLGVSQPGRILLTGPPVGLIYGAFTLTQILDAASETSAVPRTAISDWPTMITRAYTGCVRDVSEASLSRLDWFARWRINAGYYEIYGDQGQDGAPPEVADIQTEYARRGIALYGQISNWRTDLLLKRPLCAANPDDLARIRRYATELCDRGCSGLIFLFDDLTQASVEHPLTCPQCKARFKGLADAQLELMRPMIEVGRERGIDRLIVCPTPYYSNWKKSYSDNLDGVAYYNVWRDAELMDGVQVYHCLVRRDAVAEVQQAGLRNYIYWFNGAYSYERAARPRKSIDGLWGGLPRLAHGWYLYRWDAEKGVVPRDDAYDALRELPDLTRHAWLCGGGDFAWALWGSYCWDAENLDPEAMERRLVSALFGEKAAPHYEQWRATITAWLPRLMAPSEAASTAAREALIREFSADAAAAMDSAQQFKQTAVTKALAPQDTSDRMTRAAQTLSDLAAGAATSRSSVKIGPVTERKLADGTYRDQDIELGTFWNRFVLRYSQTEDADGALHRSRWHFGSGLGMKGPSYRNWYDAGFIDVLLNGKSLDAWTPTFESVPGVSGEDLLATWETSEGTVALRLGLQSGGLRIQGSLSDRDDVKLTVRLYAIPSAGSGGWEDMDKYTVTASGEAAHGTPVTLKQGEDWLLWADKTYDVPREQAEGPCAVLFGDPVPAVECANGSYVVETQANYPAGTRQFQLMIWDFHRRTNAEALAELRGLLEGARSAMR